MSDKIRVRLLNNGCYGCMDRVKFPVEVKARLNKDSLIAFICENELKRIGASDCFSGEPDGWPFMVGFECEVIE